MTGNNHHHYNRPGAKKTKEVTGDAERGSRLFKTMCIQCHAMSIRGIYGKNIASGSL
jgi:cytochrome c